MKPTGTILTTIAMLCSLAIACGSGGGGGSTTESSDGAIAFDGGGDWEQIDGANGYAWERGAGCGPFESKDDIPDPLPPCESVSISEAVSPYPSADTPEEFANKAFIYDVNRPQYKVEVIRDMEGKEGVWSFATCIAGYYSHQGEYTASTTSNCVYQAFWNVGSTTWRLFYSSRGIAFNLDWAEELQQSIIISR